MRLVFMGPPGAGKGTQSVRLAVELQIPHLSTGEMLRESCRTQSQIGLQACLAMEAGKLVPDKLVHDIVVERIAEKDCQSGYVLDGFPRTVRQAEDFDEWLRGRSAALDAVINIYAEKKVLLQRLGTRGRHDDKAAVIDKRLEQHVTLTRPLLDYYQGHGILHTVNGSRAPEDVYTVILEIVQGLSISSKTNRPPA